MSLPKRTRKNSPAAAMPLIGTPVYFKESEEQILGGLLTDASILPDVLLHMQQHFFYSQANQIVYEAIVAIDARQKKPDEMTVVMQLKKTNKLEDVGGHYYVTSLTRSVVSTANIIEHCLFVKQAYLLREASKIGFELYQQSFDNGSDPFALLELADAKIMSVQDEVVKGNIQDLQGIVKQVKENYERVANGGILGLETGLIPWDYHLRGLVPPDLIIVAARPGQGKTALALTITRYCSIKQNYPGAWFSLEMDRYQLVKRLSAQVADISHSRIDKGELDAEEKERFENALELIKTRPIYIEDYPKLNIRSLRTRLLILKRKYGILYAIVDYLQLMEAIEPNSGKKRHEEISEISRGLKVLAKELNIPIIALTQLLRDADKEPGQIPKLSHLKDGGSIEQDADTVVFIVRPETNKSDNATIFTIGETEYQKRGLAVIDVAKFRHGPIGTFPLLYVGRSMDFRTHPADDTLNGKARKGFTPIPTPTIQPVKPPYADGKTGDFSDGFEEDQPF